MTLAELVAERAEAAGDYHGNTTAASYGDAGAEWKALDAKTALLDFGHRRSVRVLGDDRVEYLHGQLSSHVESLEPGQGQAALFLNAQGRAQSLVALYNCDDSMELVVDGDQLGATIERAEQFVVADDVEFDADESVHRIAVAGPRAAALLEKLGGELPAAPWGVVETRLDGVLTRIYSRGDLRVPLFELAAEPAMDLWAALEEAGAVPCGFQSLEVARVESGTARFGIDIDHERVAMEARLEWAIHFSKGCYVGQEVIERAVSRGRLNRRLCLLRVDAPVALGAVVEGGADKEVATSLAVSPQLGRIALAYVAAARSEPGSKLRIGGVDAEVLPWPREEVLAGR